jgi:hypothetical protein
LAVLFDHRGYAHGLTHPLVKTNGGREYCRVFNPGKGRAVAGVVLRIPRQI